MSKKCLLSFNKDIRFILVSKDLLTRQTDAYKVYTM